MDQSSDGRELESPVSDVVVTVTDGDEGDQGGALRHGEQGNAPVM